MRLLWAGVVVLAVAAAAWFFFLRAPDIANYPSAGTDIIALGDSLVYGTGAPRESGFVPVLSNDIGQPIANLGHPGDTTSDVLGRLDDLDAYRPKVVILLVGGNDYLQQVSDEAVFANLASIIEGLQRRGAAVLLVGIRGGVLADPYASRFEELARTYRTAYVPDALSGLFGKKEYMSDTIHPNAQGYALLAARLAPVLKDLLQ
ncbi:MAG: lipolytic enzyme family [Candidatus Adlerbacteria bacterium]|nr:lipolytic enzyme family [Candidatus Adlerbacteria bacterium]